MKQVAVNWFECIEESLQFHEFFQLGVYPCVFHKDGMVVLVYVDDCIIISLKEKDITDFLQYIWKMMTEIHGKIYAEVMSVFLIKGSKGEIVI